MSLLDTDKSCLPSFLKLRYLLTLREEHLKRNPDALQVASKRWK